MPWMQAIIKVRRLNLTAYGLPVDVCAADCRICIFPYVMNLGVGTAAECNALAQAHHISNRHAKGEEMFLSRDKIRVYNCNQPRQPSLFAVWCPRCRREVYHCTDLTYGIAMGHIHCVVEHEDE
jgi:hypothetical protein